MKAGYSGTMQVKFPEQQQQLGITKLVLNLEPFNYQVGALTTWLCSLTHTTHTHRQAGAGRHIATLEHIHTHTIPIIDLNIGICYRIILEPHQV